MRKVSVNILRREGHEETRVESLEPPDNWTGRRVQTLLELNDFTEFQAVTTEAQNSPIIVLEIVDSSDIDKPFGLTATIHYAGCYFSPDDWSVEDTRTFLISHGLQLVEQ